LLGFPTRTYGIIFALIAVIGYVSSAYLYTYDFMGILWCYYSVGLPLLYYIIRVIR
jgi:hypothetical protein